MDRFKKEDFFTIPNYLTYFRLICVPVFIVLFFTSIKYNIYIALGVFILAEITDLLDGHIARKYNQITDVGKILDPLADKLLQVSAMISLSIIGYVPWTFAILLAIKELYMIVGSSLLVSKNIVAPSNTWGKRAATWLGYGLISSFFHPYLLLDNYFSVKTYISIDWVVIGVGIIIAFIAVFNYTTSIVRQIKGRNIGNEKIDIKY